MTKPFIPDKSKFKDEKGRYIVQGLFLEIHYNTDLAYYTLDGEDKMYKGKLYKSLKKLYLKEQDLNEWSFATKYLYDWPHWKRLCGNALLKRHIEQWREELALKARSEGIATLLHLATNENSYQAAKWLADEGWVKRGRGRPSKAEIENEAKRRAAIEEEFQDDFKMLEVIKGGKDG